MSARLSKSRFIAGSQCLLKLWNEVHRRQLATPWTESQLARFRRGSSIGELARERYPGGRLVGFEPWQRAKAIAQTAELLADAEVPAIYEAAFEHQGVFVRVDVLVRNEDGWDLVEVKSSTRPDKEVFQLDVAIQYWVLTGAGLDVRRAGVLVLNRDYVYPGGDYDLDELFRLGDATESCQLRLPQFDTQVAALEKMLAADAPPEVTPGDHCFTPYECPYYASCTEGTEQPEHPLSSLPRVSRTRLDELKALGVESIPDIPGEFMLTPLQERVRRAVVNGRPWQSPYLGLELKTARWPLHYLDFEAWQPALPEWPGTRPFQAIPFQFSLHIEQADGTLTHHEYLHEQPDDPRDALAEALLQAIRDAGSIVVYSGYERSMINALAAHRVDLREDLLHLSDRLWDLLPVIRDHYYHPDFHGSFSIKSVLPALVPGQDWSDLELSDGMAAANAYEQARNETDPEVRQATLHALREYCARDTQAMVQLMQKLRLLANL